ncbi:hypothetical protein P7E12_13395 [Enterococcus gallinarum]|uniref:hypothetical protein n=1 Tax=Enterococcus TaxID=1350 RepID=UPI00288EDCEF|nr:hypothetical protein [Enterococcus gallinarum]MDT2715175.1 hypothetical protein [Enterococcus gallinarum]
MDKLFIPVEITNMEELKKLINRAGYQIDQLKDTLEKIEKFKAQAVFCPKTSSFRLHRVPRIKT